MREFPEVGRWLGVTGAWLLASTLALPGPARQLYSEGPPPAHTGGFGEPTCHACHFDKPINDPAGSLQLLGLPSRYDPGRTYTITVGVRHPQLRRAGFQLSARFAKGDSAGRPAGLLEPLDQRTVVIAAGEPAVLFVQHTGPGSLALKPGSLLWSFAWRAPSRQRDVVFHLTANAANDDASELGDHVYVQNIIIPAYSRSDR